MTWGLNYILSNLNKKTPQKTHSGAIVIMRLDTIILQFSVNVKKKAHDKYRFSERWVLLKELDHTVGQLRERTQ